eukprot:6834078-Pyramimonas_sp.AAC.1
MARQVEEEKAAIAEDAQRLILHAEAEMAWLASMAQRRLAQEEAEQRRIQGGCRANHLIAATPGRERAR